MIGGQDCALTVHLGLSVDENRDHFEDVTELLDRNGSSRTGWGREDCRMRGPSGATEDRWGSGLRPAHGKPRSKELFWRSMGDAAALADFACLAIGAMDPGIGIRVRILGEPGGADRSKIHGSSIKCATNNQGGGRGTVPLSEASIWGKLESPVDQSNSSAGFLSHSASATGRIAMAEGTPRENG
jgi:hypothetical protein